MDNTQTFFKKNSAAISASVVLLVILIIIIAVIIFSPKNLTKDKPQDNTLSYPEVSYPTPVSIPVIVPESNMKEFINSMASFSIELPKEVVMTEMPEEATSGYIEYPGEVVNGTRGEIVFTFGEYIEGKEGQISPAQFAVSYGKPQIFGKGGACVDKDGNPANKKEVIAEQEVNVCEFENAISVSYFKNPTKDIEYQFTTINMSKEQVSIISKAIRETLKFK